MRLSCLRRWLFSCKLLGRKGLCNHSHPRSPSIIRLFLLKCSTLIEIFISKTKKQAWSKNINARLSSSLYNTTLHMLDSYSRIRAVPILVVQHLWFLSASKSYSQNLFRLLDWTRFECHYSSNRWWFGWIRQNKTLWCLVCNDLRETYQLLSYSL